MKLLEEFGAGCSILAVVLLETIAVSWFYGKRGTRMGSSNGMGPGNQMRPEPTGCSCLAP